MPGAEMSPNGARRRPWERWSTAQNLTAALLVVATGAAIGHQAAFSGWYIEDAAISFAYASHLVEGEGLVPFPGGERVEGYSNFTWVMLLALFHALGADGFMSAEPIQYVLAGLTIPVVFLAVREAVPESPVPAIAAAGALAACSQFAHWGGSGLENALFSSLMALALWRTMVEQRTGTWPWSALCWFALAITRPEAILYAAVAGALTMTYHLASGRGVAPTLKWLATFFAPWIAYQGWRFGYFAWEFPNTYYAKLNNKEIDPFAWNRRGWKYVRNWAHANWTGYLLPVYLLGLFGGRGWRVGVVLGACFASAFAVHFGSNARALFPAVVLCTFAMFFASYRTGTGRPAPHWTALSAAAALLLAGAAELAVWAGLEFQEPPTPGWWAEIPSYSLMALAMVLPAVAVGAAAWRLRVLTWCLSAIGLFFAIYVQGDWMANWRWMSLPAVPMCMLFGLGVHAAGDVVHRMFADGQRWGAPGWVAATVTLGLFIGPNALQSDRAKRDTNPYSVKKRVEYVQGVARRLHLRERPSLLDVDMGAHMVWSGFRLYDIAGLIDVPLAQHKFERPFVQEYIFEEARPHFAHVHAGWATTSRIPTFTEWRRDYVEIPGYPAGANQFHIGNHIRRDLLFVPRWPEDARRVSFEGGVVLAGWSLPSAASAPKKRFYLEVGLDTAPRKADEGFRIVAFLSNKRGTVASWDLPPAYDWVDPHSWGDSEVFHGRFSLPLPPSMPKGTYDLGFVVFDHAGRVLPPADPPDDEKALRRWSRSDQAVVPDDDNARLARGEVRFPGAFEVVSLEQRNRRAGAKAAESLAAAEGDRCLDAESEWEDAVAYRPAERRWVAQQEGSLKPAFAACWARTADGAPIDEAVLRLARGRQWDGRSTELATIGSAVADTRMAEGMDALEAEDWERAYAMFSDVLAVDPSRSWARRYAERARAKRLGIDAETKAEEEAERERRRAEIEERAAARKANDAEKKRNATAPALPRRDEGDE